MEFIFKSNAELSYIDGIGALIMIMGIVLELLADNQMHAFKKDQNNKGQTITTGVWRYSRHPNYLGEILFWWGLYTLSISAGAIQLLITGPILMTLLFITISIPMMEKRLASKYDGYLEYKKNTSMIIPFKF